MVQSFRERYITREEHQRIVDYYRKLVARLYGDVRDLRAQAEVPVKEAQPATERAGKAPHDLGPNVVSLGSYRNRRKSRI
ncbi:hypothetical protein FHT78_000065 [Rhizobium sp. BK196]|jgi:hypothetical protein|uniref:hypothetical protein n=1 Tax=Rhizobium sp. BK196 TaxID=2587073 RepID=UPI00161AF741|nr:hypothetical protein [Rhizobium sp. BK196]MBB3308336.1 hypothetical protein [Rhizobium sp. BK196]